MKKKINSLKEYYTAHPKRFWALGIIILLVLFGVLTHKSVSTITVIPIKQSDLKQTVLATGQVTSATDLNLSFSASGLVSTLPVAVGDKVYKGQVLATLENRSEYASLNSAKANYRKVIEGASNEEVAVAETALKSAQADLVNTQKVQDTLVQNAYRTLLNTDLTPILSSGTSSGNAPTVTGTYSGTNEGSYVINPNVTSGTNGYITYTGLETGTATISTTNPVPLGTKGLYIQFPANFSSNLSSVWTILLPNIKSANYLNNFNAYQNAQKTHDSAISTAETKVAERQADLDLKKATARPADVGVAQASVDEAQATYEKTVLFAPIGGTIVHVDTKIGERADAQKEVVVIQDVGNLYVEANINETSIAKVSVGQPVTMTLDAFGPDMQFTGKVVHIDPSSTTSDGVVNYKIKSSIELPKCGPLDQCARLQDMVRPGMNANMTITAWDRGSVIAIPKASITEKDHTFSVQVVLSEKKKKYETRTITVGNQGDGNLVEVINGLSEGEKIVVSTR